MLGSLLVDTRHLCDRIKDKFRTRGLTSYSALSGIMRPQYALPL